MKLTCLVKGHVAVRLSSAVKALPVTRWKCLRCGVEGSDNAGLNRRGYSRVRWIDYGEWKRDWKEKQQEKRR